EGQNYSFDMGFLDWSEYPQGGRHEELGWLQATYLGGLRNAADIANVITPYFAYYEQSARALCGDPTSALRVFRDYIGGMLETEDAATIWEYYIPTLRDLRRYSSHLDLNWNWPTSLCHGWGAGAVPLTTEFLLGIIPLKPGFSEIKLSPAAGLTWDYEARVPTPFGPITVEKNGSSGKPHFIVPKDISIRETTATKSELTVDFSN
ncbi:MAG: hypothetical protein WCP55_20200, partial [Lentisphaerota bacterium]